jgi:hypothetical protein
MFMELYLSAVENEEGQIHLLQLTLQLPQPQHIIILTSSWYYFQPHHNIIFNLTMVLFSTSP